jgi:hypothetical protein
MNDNEKIFKMPRRFTDWVLSGVTVTSVLGAFVIIGLYAEKTSHLENLIAKEEGARKHETNELKESLQSLSDNMNELVIAQKLTNQKLESIDKSTASIKDMKEVLILWQSQIQKSQYIFPQSYKKPLTNKKLGKLKIAYSY